jgi:hypothetical protein
LLVFGANLNFNGVESDLRKATETAARMARHLGHGDRISCMDVSTNKREWQEVLNL